MAMNRDKFYVSITGLRLKARRHMFRFWWHSIRSMAQARQAPGNVKAEARIVQGVHHTLSVWVDEQAMRAFLLSGAHRQAMRAFRAIGTGCSIAGPSEKHSSGFIYRNAGCIVADARKPSTARQPRYGERCGRS